MLLFFTSRFILTNYHVMQGYNGVERGAKTGQTVKIRLGTDRYRAATLVYYECDNDLALLEIQGNPIRNIDLLKAKEIKFLLKLLEDAIAKQKTYPSSR